MAVPQAAPLRATARLQFHAGFTLDDAVPLVPYLARLGISHLYASPILKARPGSTHGYDIVDHGRINPELGGEAALGRLTAALRAAGMGLILDIVPNHMGVGGSDNAWWLDVLEWGRQSPYAPFFDIDWEPPDRTLQNRLLAPFLGAPYGEVLASGDLRLRFEAATGRLDAWYFEHRFPIAPQHYHHVLVAAGDPALEPLAQAFGRIGLRQRDRGEARAEAARAHAALAALATRPEGGAMLEAALAAFDPATEAGRDRLHRLLERQHYRLAWWRAAADEINWRRFFDITSLAGLRAELPEVFDATHELVLRLYAEGSIDGVRIDHVDGLADPRGYCRKLHRRMQAVRPEQQPLIWVEKILAPFEALRTDWLVDGTTGYDFMDEASGVLHDPAGEAPLTDLWTGTTGRPALFETEAREARRQILRDNLASELHGTAAALKRVAARDLATRDFTLTALRRALAEVLVHFPVYRLYITPGGRVAEDKRILAWALAGARRTVRATERPLLELLDAWLGGEAPRSLPPAQRRERLTAAVRFQQLSAPVAAKSVEDTAFYRYGRLLSRNEVGSDPGHFTVTPAGFHATARARAKQFPRALLATATHDHKRGEDTRARLAVLSEIAPEWAAAVARWTRLNAPLRRELEGGPAPGMSAQIMLYQTLVGAWPLGLDPGDEAGVGGFLERVAAWQGEGAARGQAPHRMGGAQCRIRGRLPRLPLRHDGARAGQPHAGRDRRLRRPDRPRGRGERLGATRAALRRAGRAGPLPGHRVLGFQPGRSRQPPPGGLGGAPGGAGGRHLARGAAAAVAGRAGEAGGAGPRPGAQGGASGALRCRRLPAAGVGGAARRASSGLRPHPSRPCRGRGGDAPARRPARRCRPAACPAGGMGGNRTRAAAF
ncbi:malto-oligosyltrehalose synthase [Siccirubricoccus sp. G192]|uniref:malto-oligosyltrehalose synthase n=1 Tax=Siccirubricoccus sp. G192 TaxID=2849651 RepID=UPI001C2BC995|nr:malto-oligosyltrehalose synthase [Siccirubricoccus sp. G192]MBV1799851.1 malto-oligosyltrehalose synthase [Siccirubricoccus sp. G192]